MYTYRIGEKKSIGAQVADLSSATTPTITSATMRLYAPNTKLIWEKAATVVHGNQATFQLTDINKIGQYTVQWVCNIGSSTILSDPMPLLVKSASEA